MTVIAKPNTFSPNTTISSSDMNDNFDTLYNDYNGSIAAANLAASAVTTAKIADSNVTTAKIADSNVTTAKIADGAVTSEKLNATIAARAYLNSAQTTNTGVYTKVLLDTENYDLGADFDTANSRFVAPVTGYYQVNARARFTDLADGSVALTNIYVNGSAYSEGRSYNSLANGDPGAMLSDLVPASAGQYIELYALQNSASPESITTGTLETFMSVYFVGV